ncbi:MAG TPA: endolytic transglycosylase MltG [Mesorhizobium sp.]|jgi:UPF0755 protein|nr:endolytic transglycosylase MltG [Mesorhizobium sp.]
MNASTPSSEIEFGRRAAPPAADPADSTTGTPIKPARDALRPANTATPRRSRRSRSQVVVFLNFMMSLIVFAVLAAGAAVYWGRSTFEAPGPNPQDTTFLVKPRTGVSDIATQLERQGLITNADVFNLGVRAHGAGSSLKAGEYEIAARASMRDIMEALASGRSIMHSLTIPEGLTVLQAWDRIAAHEALSGDMPETVPPEGSLAADTQRFTRGTSRRAVVEKMLADQARMVEEIWAKRDPDLPIADANEFVTLASIVEKETGVAEERPQVASVFVNRLREGMRLQSDPTIIYGLFGGKGKPADRPIYQSDIEKPTPYNTYVINGLPPGPIANPGRAALEAVANPAETDYLYFVADGSGGHAFASSLEEHNRNVAKWRTIEAAQPAGSGEDGGAAPAE